MVLGGAFVVSGNVLGCGCLSTLTGVDALSVGDWASRAMLWPALVQLAWVVPFAGVALLLGRRRTAAGLVAAALAVGLVNAAVWGLVAAGVVAPPGG